MLHNKPREYFTTETYNTVSAWLQPHFALTKEMHAVSEKYCGRRKETGHYDVVSKQMFYPDQD